MGQGVSLNVAMTLAEKWHEQLHVEGKGAARRDSTEPALPLLQFPRASHPHVNYNSLRRPPSPSIALTMPVQLGGSTRQSYMSAVGELFSLHPDQPRKQLAKQVALQSVRVRLSEVIAAGRKGAGRSRGRSSAQDQEQLDGFHDGNVPLRIRPALVVLNALTLIILGLMGFHPRGQAFVPFNDKVLHFACFFFVGCHLALSCMSTSTLTLCVSYRPRDYFTASGTSMSLLEECGFGDTCHSF